MKTVEFLLYTLKPGTGKDFHRIMKEVECSTSPFSGNGCYFLWYIST